MARLKLLIENMLIYGLSGIVGSIIPFVMLPIVTRIMPDASYMGVYDVFTSVTSLLTTFSIFGMYDAMFRLFFEKEDDEYKKTVCSSAILVVSIISILTMVILIWGADILSILLLGDVKYKKVLWIASVNIVIGALNVIVGAPTRMQNKRILMLGVNVLTPLVAYSVAFILLKRGCYEYGMQIGSVLSVLSSLIIFTCTNRKWFELRNVNISILKQMAQIAIPIVPVFLIYWIFSAADRLIISAILGTTAVGIYAVGAKIAQISQLLYVAFSGGWQYFAFSTMRDKNQVEMVTYIFEILEGVAFVFSILVLAVVKWPYQYLFEKQYWGGVKAIPFLFVLPFFLMLFQIVGNQFLVVKKSYYSTFCLVLGVISNIMFNFILIKPMGFVGVSVASLIGYLVSLISALIILWKLNLINLKMRMLRVGIIELLYLGVWQGISISLYKSILISSIFVFAITLNYIKEIKGMLGIVICKMKKYAG